LPSAVRRFSLLHSLSHRSPLFCCGALPPLLFSSVGAIVYRSAKRWVYAAGKQQRSVAAGDWEVESLLNLLEQGF